LRVAQVKVIFNLPQQFGAHAHPLAYVEWFTRIGTPETASGMSVIPRSTQNLRPNAEVVSLEQLTRGCHLIGKAGATLDPTWNADNILDKADSFYLNSYIHLDTFATLKTSTYHLDMFPQS
jgi:hypothetical protein